MPCCIRTGAILVTLLGCGLTVCALHYRNRNEFDPEAEEQRTRKLEHTQALLEARRDARRQLIDELIAGRLSLPEVTDQFQKLNRQPPEIASQTAEAFPGANEREATACQVVKLTRILIAEYNLTLEQRDLILERLEAQLQEMRK